MKHLSTASGGEGLNLSASGRQFVHIAAVPEIQPDQKFYSDSLTKDQLEEFKVESVAVSKTTLALGVSLPVLHSLRCPV